MECQAQSNRSCPAGRRHGCRSIRRPWTPEARLSASIAPAAPQSAPGTKLVSGATAAATFTKCPRVSVRFIGELPTKNQASRNTLTFATVRWLPSQTVHLRLSAGHNNHLTYKACAKSEAGPRAPPNVVPCNPQTLWFAPCFGDELAAMEAGGPRTLGVRMSFLTVRSQIERRPVRLDHPSWEDITPHPQPGSLLKV